MISMGYALRARLAPLLLTLAAVASCARRPPPAPAATDGAVVAAASASSAPGRIVEAAAPDASREAGRSADLAADLEARGRQARARFGAKARLRTVAGLFVLVEVGHTGPLFDQGAALVERTVTALRDGRLRAPPDRAVTVLFFDSTAAYTAHCLEGQDPRGAPTFGLYRRDLREIAVNESGGADYLPTLTHEILHPLLDADFPGAPLWFDEGLAALFEAPVFDADGGVHGAPRNWRQPYLSEALASPATRALVTLPALFAMPPLTVEGLTSARPFDRSDPRLRYRSYAMARSFTTWLDHRGLLWPFYRAWRDAAAEDPTGVKTLERVVGGSPAALNDEWLRWAR